MVRAFCCLMGLNPRKHRGEDWEPYGHGIHRVVVEGQLIRKTNPSLPRKVRNHFWERPSRDDSFAFFSARHSHVGWESRPIVSAIAVLWEWTIDFHEFVWIIACNWNCRIFQSRHSAKLNNPRKRRGGNLYKNLMESCLLIATPVSVFVWDIVHMHECERIQLE